MANITPRKNKDGVITSYTIRVYHGYGKDGKRLKPYTMSYKPAPNMTARQIEKELNRQTFAEYAAYVVSLKERAGVKHSVICWYKAQLERVNAGIGHLKLCEIRPQHLNALYEQLSSKGLRENGKKAVCKMDLSTVLKSSGRTKVDFAKAAGVSVRTLASCCEGNAGSYSTAEKIAKELNCKVKSVFDLT